MAKRQIGTPRFYCDVLSYLKSIGKYFGSNESNIVGSNAGEEKVWNMNPYQINSYNLDNAASQFNIRFWINQDPANLSNQIHKEDPELHKLLAYINSSDGHHSSGWYGGVLGHNLASLQSQTGHNISIGQTFIGKHPDPAITNPHYANPNAFEEIVNYESGGTSAGWGVAKYDGYSLWELTERGSDSDMFRYNMIDFTLINADNDQAIGTTDNLKVGAYTTGIFIEAPNSPDLSVKKTLEMSGISVNETIAGNTLVNIKHKGVPNWGDQPAWTLQKTDGRDYTNVANRARRIWDMSFSYISDDNLFDAAQNSNSFFNDTFDEFDGEETYNVSKFDTSMSSFFKLTQNGALPFIFCPDSKADNLEFAICMLDQDSISCTQVAHRTWNVSLSIREVY
jgi:hypothetical protein